MSRPITPLRQGPGSFPAPSDASPGARRLALARRRRARRLARSVAVLVALGVLGSVLVGRGSGAREGVPEPKGTVGRHARPVQAAHRHRGSVASHPVPLPAPAALAPFYSAAAPGEGRWRPAGRPVDGHSALYETTLRLPDNASVVAGLAWMDTRLLKARLYSGSLSPGGLSWHYTAPVSLAASKTLVAAYNGGFLLKDSNGGYLSEGATVAPLRQGAASLVIYANGSATVGQWGRDVTMTPSVVAVRQNLTLLVDHGKAAPGLTTSDTSVWGSALNAAPDTWRSGLGLTADGALVYVAGPMNIVDLADMLLRAGAVRAMTLDMNPLWTVFASYRPATPGGYATPANGTDLLPDMVQGPQRFFSLAYARDFVTMSG